MSLLSSFTTVLMCRLILGFISLYTYPPQSLFKVGVVAISRRSYPMKRCVSDSKGEPGLKKDISADGHYGTRNSE